MPRLERILAGADRHALAVVQAVKAATPKGARAASPPPTPEMRAWRVMRERLHPDWRDLVVEAALALFDHQPDELAEALFASVGVPLDREPEPEPMPGEQVPADDEPVESIRNMLREPWAALGALGFHWHGHPDSAELARTHWGPGKGFTYPQLVAVWPGQFDDLPTWLGRVAGDGLAYRLCDELSLVTYQAYHWLARRRQRGRN